MLAVVLEKQTVPVLNMGPMARLLVFISLAAAELYETESGEVEFQQSLLQHVARVSKNESISICDTVTTPDPSPLATSMNHGNFYIIALSNDTALNPTSIGYFEKYNFRTHLQGSDERRSLYFTNWWMESDDPSSNWVFEDGSRNITDPASKKKMAMKDAICVERGCRLSQWHVEVWKGFPLFINWSCSGFYVGHEVLWGGAPSHPDLLAYAWSLIKAKGGGIERYPLNAIRNGPHDQPCPCGF
ncbi:unnamed protein product [Symbiodinium necroappetens]|uniref:Uncharacterized protein n=1 Tax=Symbiodinium necroappetens TaxID=1628268 RepID=A0A813A2Q9_9DINO|nr:unnamed protein product [Symbiodinium necroappetens]